jgi:acyl-CoA thioester hydrolase
MGVVYHANYLIWMEVGRVELMRQLGFDYKLMESQDDCFIAVVEANCRYKAPARYDDVILVATQLTGFRGSVVKFRYQILREADDKLLAEGETTHVVTNRNLQKSALPAKYVEAFQRILNDASSSKEN